MMNVNVLEYKIMEWYNKYRNLLLEGIKRWVEYLKYIHKKEITSDILRNEIDNVTYGNGIYRRIREEGLIFTLEDFIVEVAFFASIRFFGKNVELVEEEIYEIDFKLEPVRNFVFHGAIRELANDICYALADVTAVSTGKSGVMEIFKKIYDEYFAQRGKFI